ncbi:hotdog domain-containing protein [Microbacterium sp. ET2]|uniref:hotdog domain-containing protein n=1 Tax=Microbacterium albipurpureum TaxID=3050384 RepID=UPI00259D2A6D|nr:hotdog domain-containing protein [Microbacterium sp. ET2 (Ac-2212)]WJL94438.1 hotdog domain-containing protein [Microbacterium sp. ET2 (Ac-2212)]
MSAEPPVTDAAAPADRVTMRFLALPHDAAAGGLSVAAGSVMEWIDQAGYACAVGWSGRYCVTAYVGNVQHTRPIAPGSLVAVHARVVHTGRSSVHVAVTVEAADIRSRRYEPATTCMLVFVAVDDDRRPASVPEWTPRTDADRALGAIATSRIAARDTIKKAMLSQVYTDDTAAPRSQMRFLAPPSAVNFGGAAHGGTVMGWIDEAAFACAAAWSSDKAVAVYSGGIHFLAPVRIGHVVEPRRPPDLHRAPQHAHRRAGALRRPPDARRDDPHHAVHHGLRRSRPGRPCPRRSTLGARAR